MEDIYVELEIHCAKSVLLIKFAYTKEKMNKKILGIGNAIIDVLAKVDDEFLKKNQIINMEILLILKKVSRALFLLDDTFPLEIFFLFSK